MPKFVKAGVSDAWFPYGKGLLRQLLQDARLKDEFYKQQEAVLSRGFDGLDHHHFWNTEEQSDEIKELGSGVLGLSGTSSNLEANATSRRSLYLEYIFFPTTEQRTWQIRSLRRLPS
jgi:hypothetical protein